MKQSTRNSSFQSQGVCYLFITETRMKWVKIIYNSNYSNSWEIQIKKKKKASHKIDPLMVGLQKNVQLINF